MQVHVSHYLPNPKETATECRKDQKIMKNPPTETFLEDFFFSPGTANDIGPVGLTDADENR